MKWRKLHELTPWDERTIFRAHESAKMRGTHSDADWSNIFKKLRTPPPAPPFRVALFDDRIELTPPEPAGQLELSAAAQALGFWRFANVIDAFDPRLPFRLFPIIGIDAFTKSNSWIRRIYTAPMIIANEGQRYDRAWSTLHALLVARDGDTLSISELRDLSVRAIGASLTGSEAEDFWRSVR